MKNTLKIYVLFTIYLYNHLVEHVYKTHLYTPSLYHITGTIQDVPTVLYVPLVDPCMNSEKLAIFVDVQLGTFKVSIYDHSKFTTNMTTDICFMCMYNTMSFYTEAPDMTDIQEAVNTDRRGLRSYLTKLRYCIYIYYIYISSPSPHHYFSSHVHTIPVYHL